MCTTCLLHEAIADLYFIGALKSEENTQESTEEDENQEEDSEE